MGRFLIPSQEMASDGSWPAHNIIGDCLTIEVDELILVASRRIGVGSYSWEIEPILKGVFVFLLEQDVSASIVLIDNRIIQERIVLSDESPKLVVLIAGFKLVPLDRGYAARHIIFVFGSIADDAANMNVMFFDKIEEIFTISKVFDTFVNKKTFAIKKLF